MRFCTGRKTDNGTSPAALHVGEARILVNNRRKIRSGLKVVHRHRIGEQVFRRVSELVMIEGQPKALLGWINLAGIRTPIYLCDLDRSKLRRSAKRRDIFFYDGVTVDPRFEALGPPPHSGDAPSKFAPP